MYQKEDRNQIKLREFILPFGGHLAEDNRWVKMEKLMPCTGSKPQLPEHMLPVEPDGSRFLDAIAKSADEKNDVRAQTIGVTSFRSLKGGDENV